MFYYNITAEWVVLVVDGTAQVGRGPTEARSRGAATAPATAFSCRQFLLKFQSHEMRSHPSSVCVGDTVARVPADACSRRSRAALHGHKRRESTGISTG